MKVAIEEALNELNSDEVLYLRCTAVSLDGAIIIIMSLTPVSFSYEDIGGVPSMQSCYSARMKRCGICMEERSPL